MSVSLETIDLLRKRANVSYEEAKLALEKNNGDPVEALIFLEKENKTKSEKEEKKTSGTILNSITGTIKGLIEKGNNSRLVIGKQDNNIFNLSMTLTVIGSIAAPVIPLVGIPLAFLTNHKIRIEKKNGEDIKVNEVLDKVSSTVSSMVNQTNQEPHKESKE